MENIKGLNEFEKIIWKEIKKDYPLLMDDLFDREFLIICRRLNLEELKINIEEKVEIVINVFLYAKNLAENYKEEDPLIDFIKHQEKMLEMERKENYLGDGVGLHTEDSEIYNFEKKSIEDLENLIKAELYIKTIINETYKENSNEDKRERERELQEAWKSLLENDPIGAVKMSSYLQKVVKKLENSEV